MAAREERTVAVAAPATWRRLVRRERAQERRSRRALVRRGLALADAVALLTATAAAELVRPLAGGAHGDLDLGLSLLAIPVFLLVAAGYGLYSGDRVRADNSTLDDFWPIFHALTVG